LETFFCLAHLWKLVAIVGTDTKDAHYCRDRGEDGSGILLMQKFALRIPGAICL